MMAMSIKQFKDEAKADEFAKEVNGVVYSLEDINGNVNGFMVEYDFEEV